jgi:hypothetical protein
MRQPTRVHLLSLVVVGLAVVSLSACSQSERATVATTPRIEERTFQLTPPQVSVKAGFLVGEFADLRVSERIEQGTGRVVEAPKLVGNLQLKNASDDQAARPLGGQVTYFDEAGKPIHLSEGRSEATFEFPYYQDRLDPGKATTARLDVPFPAAALKDKHLGEVRLELSYIPIPIWQETMNVKVALSPGQ